MHILNFLIFSDFFQLMEHKKLNKGLKHWVYWKLFHIL